jgi:hypothetical protein
MPCLRLYGTPTVELFGKAEAGQIASGGCCVSQDDPYRRCGSCNADIYRAGDARQDKPK